MELNIDEVAQLAELVSEHDLSELTVETDGIKIKLRRGAKVSAAHMTMAAPMALQAPAAATPEAEEDDPASDALTIKAPIVGTFYAAPAPDTPSFVKPGDRVEPETVVCVVEAMKVMNEIKAEVSGVIRRSMVENATPVEYGQPLFEVDPA
jgi:acetyl-CoA carboxylase biotin carboxyl carrier protein